MTSDGLLIIPVFVPIFLGILAFILPRYFKGGKEGLALLAAGMSVATALLMFFAGEKLHWEFSYPALEIRFDFRFSEILGLNLVVACAMEALVLLLLVFAAPRRLRSNEYFFFLLYGFGIVNGILLSEEYVDMVLFGELLFVAIYGLTALLAFASSMLGKTASPPEAATHRPAADGGACSRIFSLFGLGLTRWVKGVAWFIFVTIDRGIDSVYERLLAGGGKVLTAGLKAAHNGLYANYLSWVVGGFIFLVWFLAMGAW